MPTLPQTPLTLAECQAFVDAMKKAKGWDANSVRDEFFLMVEEVGEVANCLRHLTWPSSKDQAAVKANLAGELTDVMNFVLSIAEMSGIDMEQAFRDKNTELLGRTYDKIVNA